MAQFEFSGIIGPLAMLLLIFLLNRSAAAKRRAASQEPAQWQETEEEGTGTGTGTGAPQAASPRRMEQPAAPQRAPLRPATAERHSDRALRTTELGRYIPDEAQSLETIPGYCVETPRAAASACAEASVYAAASGYAAASASSAASDAARASGRGGSRSTAAPGRTGGEAGEDEAVAAVRDEFDLRQASLYSEILKPKFDEE